MARDVTRPGGPIGPIGPVGPIGPIGPGPKRPDLRPFATPTSAEVFRPDDGLHLSLRYVPPAPLGGPARLIVGFDPQHVGEQTFTLKSAPTAPQPEGQTAGPSRLVFTLASPDNPLGGSLEALLQLIATRPMVLVVQAGAPQPKSALRAPGDVETAIELPWRLLLSPANAGAAWQHASAPKTISGRTGLWFTRLVGGSTRGSAPSVKPVWSPDYPALGGDFNSPMSPDDRRQLVAIHAEAGNTVIDGKVPPTTWVPPPLTPEALWLTPIGGTLRLRGSFPNVAPFGPGGQPTGNSTSLIGWSHRAELGRDMRVEVVLSGRLAPFGHEATLTTISERTVVNGRALLVKRKFLTVVEPVRRFSAANLNNFGTAFPLASVTLLTRVVDVTEDNILSGPQRVTAAGVPVDFDCRCTDLAGNSAGFRMQMLWADTTVKEGDLVKAWPGTADPVAQLGGARLQLAVPPAGVEPAAHSVSRLRIGTATHDAGRLAPSLETLEVEVPGSAEYAGGRQVVQVQWAKDYRATGITDDRIGAYLVRAEKDVKAKIVSIVPELFGAGATAVADMAGGVLTPTMVVQGFAHKLGVIAGAGKAVGDAEKAVALLQQKLTAGLGDEAIKKLMKQYLPDIRILGVVSLAELIDVAEMVEKNLPKLQRVVEKGGQQTLKFDMGIAGPKMITLAGPLRFERKLNFKLGVAASVKLGVGTQKALVSIDAPMVEAFVQDFGIGFMMAGSSLRLQVKKLSFQAAAGKPLFDLTFADPVIAIKSGPLAFITKLIALVPHSAFADPPDVQILPTGVSASYTIALPPVQLGAFSLSNIGFAAGFVLPFVGGRPALRLALSSREAPFSLLIACLGGGGYVAFELDTAGLRMLEVSLEAQAGAALNLGVARGAVLVRLGIHFRLTLTDGNTDILLEGFVEVSGAVCVLAIITVSIVANLTLGYESVGNKVTGRATVKVGIKVLFVKKTVSFAIERQFAGAGSDPAFADAFDSDGFNRYLKAFG